MVSRQDVVEVAAAPSSATAASTSPAQPPVRGPSSTTTSRLVFATDARIVAPSSGRSVRRSMTSASTPSPARGSAAARQSCTRFIGLTSVTSAPSRTTRGLADRPTLAVDLAA